MNSQNSLKKNFKDTKKECDSIVHYYNDILNLKSEVETINNSRTKSVFDYDLNSLNFNSIQTTINKYELEYNIIINKLSNTVNNCESKYSLLISKTFNRDEEDIRTQFDITDRYRNLLRNEYFEL